MSVVLKDLERASGRFGLLFRRGMGRMCLSFQEVANRSRLDKRLVVEVAEGRAHTIRHAEVRRIMDVALPKDIGRMRSEAFHLLLIFTPRPRPRFVRRIHPSRRFAPQRRN